MVGANSPGGQSVVSGNLIIHKVYEIGFSWVDAKLPILSVRRIEQPLDQQVKVLRLGVDRFERQPHPISRNLSIASMVT